MTYQTEIKMACGHTETHEFLDESEEQLWQSRWTETGKCEACVLAARKLTHPDILITRELPFDFVNGLDPVADVGSPQSQFGERIASVYDGRGLG